MTRSDDARSLRIAIIGAGPGGGVSGTWYHNRYPGCACDLPSALYSLSFEIKRDWSRPSRS